MHFGVWSRLIFLYVFTFAGEYTNLGFSRVHVKVVSHFQHLGGKSQNFGVLDDQHITKRVPVTVHLVICITPYHKFMSQQCLNWPYLIF